MALVVRPQSGGALVPYRESREIQYQAAEIVQEPDQVDDFVIIKNNDRPFVPELLYPVDLLRTLVKRIAKESGDSQLLHEANNIEFQTDEHLDVYFVKYITPFLNKLFYDRKMSRLRQELEQIPEYGHLFQKLVHTYTVRRGDVNYEEINRTRYDAMALKIKEMRSTVKEQTLALTQYLRKANPVDPHAADQMAQLIEKNEKTLRLMETHLHIFTEMLEEYNKSSDETLSLSLWGIAGFAVSLIASTVFLSLPQGIALASTVGELGGALGITSTYIIGASAGALTKKSIDAGKKLMQHLRGPDNSCLLRVPKFLDDQNEACYAFYRRSTGFKMLMGYASGTAGLLFLPFPQDHRVFRFNVKNNTRLNANDLLEIQARLLRALQCLKMKPEECMAYLKRLKQAKICTDNTIWGGFVDESEMEEYFAPVIRRCMILNPNMIV